MSYQLGIDLGTTYTAAAVFRDGAATICTLGSRTAAIPSVVLLRADGTVLIGDAAERRATTEPERVVREFKRRLGDTTPIIVGGAPYTAEALSAKLLESVVADVKAREGGDPTRTVITHPANWGNYKRDLLQQTVRLAGLDPADVEFLTEPEAAALSYAAQERIDPGEVVAVYDLGGGTFDAAVLRRTPEGFSVLGRPEGIERLGGIDFDAAVFAHVTAGIGTALAELDHNDPAALAAVARLRLDCVEAKEALSSDTDASVPVLLPNLQTEVRITRQEFEAMIRTSLLDSLEAMRRAVRSADLEIHEVSRVLLVGGSSRIPLVSLLVGSELGRPVAVDAHPKHAIAIGAAFAASGILEDSADSPTPPPAAELPRGVNPNMTIVAPAHLYNPGTGSGKPLPLERPSSRTPRSDPAPARPAAQPPTPNPVPSTPAARPSTPNPVPTPKPSLPVERPAASAPGKALPVERPGAAAPGKALPVERPAASAPGKALPIERPGSPPPGAARPTPPPQATPPRSDPRPPPPGGGGAPPAADHARRNPAPNEHDPTSLYRSPGEVSRTEVYPGGKPPSFDPGRGGGAPSGPGPAPGVSRAAAPQATSGSGKSRRSGLAWFIIVLVLAALVVAGILLAGALS